MLGGMSATEEAKNVGGEEDRHPAPLLDQHQHQHQDQQELELELEITSTSTLIPSEMIERMRHNCEQVGAYLAAPATVASSWPFHRPLLQLVPPHPHPTPLLTDPCAQSLGLSLFLDVYHNLRASDGSNALPVSLTSPVHGRSAGPARRGATADDQGGGETHTEGGGRLPAALRRRRRRRRLGVPVAVYREGKEMR
eukprot:758381-Hanusia_phi.AAC.1